MEKKIKFIPCAEKVLINARHTTGKMKSNEYKDKRGAALTRRNTVRSAKKQQEMINKNKAYRKSSNSYR